MPIYAYKCSACGHTQDVLQKLSASPLTDCPACGKATYSKQITAPQFQLKGSGWYVTDFKGGSNGGKDNKTKAEAAGTDATPGTTTETKPAPKTESGTAAPGHAAPAAPAAAPAPAKPAAANE